METETEKEESPPTVKGRPGVRLNKLADVRRLLGRIINQNLRGEMANEQLKAVSYASQCLVKIFELEQLSSRLDRIEALLAAKK